MKDRAIKHLSQYIQFPDNLEFTARVRACYKPALLDFLSRDKGQAWVCARRTGPNCIGEMRYTDGIKKLNLIIMIKPFCSESYWIQLLLFLIACMCFYYVCVFFYNW